jgi:dATP pyrophosphohydrolase
LTKLKKIPISTQIIVFTNQKQILLLQRKDNPNYWQSVTGSLEMNEAPRDCAIRELYEETNLNANHYNFFSLGKMNQYSIYPEWRHRYEDGVNNNTEHLFALQLPKKENIIINKEEHLSYKWLNLEDAIKKVFSWTNRKALIKFKKLYE